MKNITCNFVSPGYLPIGEICYGTVVTDVPSHPQSIYMKVSKSYGEGLRVNYTRNHCVLVNLKSATLRQIPGDVMVKVLQEHLTVAPTEDTDEYRKGYV